MNRPFVESPCVGQCEPDADREFCLGCFRTMDEVLSWAKMDNDAKQQVWDQLPDRRRRLGANRRA